MNLKSFYSASPFRGGLLAVLCSGLAMADAPGQGLLDLDNREPVQLDQDIELRLDQLLQDRGLDWDVLPDDLAFAPGFQRFGVAPSSAPFPPASVRTDSDSEALLERADEFARNGRYDLASVLWQQVIDQSGDVLLERDDWKQRTLQNEYQRYRPMINEIEASLAGLDGDGLESYRLKTDGEARALMIRSKREDRESALAEVIQRYFLSSLGDDAAFELACIKMERREFLPAVRLLTKIIREYPDTNVLDADIQSRLAGALARVGAWTHALQLVENLKEAYPQSIAKWERVQADIEAVRSSQSGGTAPDEAVSVSTPNLVMPPLPYGELPDKLRVTWSQNYELVLPEGWPRLPESPLSPMPKLDSRTAARAVAGAGGVRGRNAPPAPPAGTQPTMRERWIEHQWMPSGELLAHGGMIYFKTEDRLVCSHADRGDLEWLGFRNAFPLDDSTMKGGRFARSAVHFFPNTPEEYFSFGDSVHQSMTVSGDRIFVLQGKPLDFLEPGKGRDEEVEQIVRAARMPRMEYSRARENRLVAYHRITGKLLWMREANDEVDRRVERTTGFARAPLTYGSIIVAPVHEESNLWLYGINAETGETVWKTYLCDEPFNLCRGLSPVGTVIDAGEAYVSTGAGYVFSLDAISGALNWAVRYPRSRKPNDYGLAIQLRVQSSSHPVNELDGWRQDFVMAYGNALVIAASDFNQLFALSRRTGSLLWESPKQPFRDEEPADYLLGSHNGMVFVGGSRVVRGYDVMGGKLLWDTPLKKVSYGRGFLTERAIYIPHQDAVTQIDPATGTIVATAAVALEEDGEPLGNLFSDGHRLLVHGMKRVYALEPEASPTNASNDSSDRAIPDSGADPAPSPQP